MMQTDIFRQAYLDDLKSEWRATIEGDGGHCPCCDKWGKISPFSITETHALALLWLSRAPCDDDGWVNVPPIAPAWMLRGKNYTMMAKWGLIEHGGTLTTANAPTVSGVSHLKVCTSSAEPSPSPERRTFTTTRLKAGQTNAFRLGIVLAVILTMLKS